MEGLTPGRIVHYVMENGEHRPAIVVRVWDGVYAEPGVVNLQVFHDQANDGYGLNVGPLWATSVHHDPAGATPRSWHWIERA